MRPLCLIDHGSKARVPWTERAILPYVAHLDERGRPTDWLFDSLLCIGLYNSIRHLFQVVEFEAYAKR